MLGPVMAAVVAAALLAAPAVAKATAQRHGPCENSSARWVLTVQPGHVAKTLRIRFVVLGATPGEAWQVALSDGAHRLPGVDLVVKPNGAFRVIRAIHDRPRPDNIIVAATNTNGSGEICTGRATF